MALKITLGALILALIVIFILGIVIFKLIKKNNKLQKELVHTEINEKRKGDLHELYKDQYKKLDDVANEQTKITDSFAMWITNCKAYIYQKRDSIKKSQKSVKKRKGVGSIEYHYYRGQTDLIQDILNDVIREKEDK